MSRPISFEHQVRVGRKKHERPYSSVFYGCFSCILSDTAGLQSVQCLFMQDVALQMVIFYGAPFVPKFKNEESQQKFSITYIFTLMYTKYNVLIYISTYLFIYRRVYLYIGTSIYIYP